MILEISALLIYLNVTNLMQSDVCFVWGVIPMETQAMDTIIVHFGTAG